MWKYAIEEMDEITYKDLACELMRIFSQSIDLEDITLLSGAQYMASAVIKKQLGDNTLEIFTPLCKSRMYDKSYRGLSELEIAIDGRHYLLSRTFLWDCDFFIVCPYMEDDSSDVYDNKGSLSNVGVFTLRVFFGTNHIYGLCHSFCSKVEYVL